MHHRRPPSELSTASSPGAPLDSTQSDVPKKHVRFQPEVMPLMGDDVSPTSDQNIHHEAHTMGHSQDHTTDDGTNEHSPLLPPRPGQEDGVVPVWSGISSTQRSSSASSWDEDTQQESKSSWYLFLLTLSFGGLQLAWAAELSNGSPFLLSLGISKSLLAFVWIAGPLSGTLMQPYIGIKSDRCRSRFGKRRPFMVGGAAATIVSLLALAWTREIVGGILHVFGVQQDSEAVKNAAIVFAVLMIYVLDFSINAIQAGIRAFIVDNAPTHQQDAANAWASRLMSMGNIVGYLFGFADLPKHFWFFGDTQFKVLCVVASLGLSITLTISCCFVSEKDPRLEGDPGKQEGGIVALFKNLFLAIRRLPPQIRKICIVQLAAWMGWFPFLFYTTTYIGEIYVDPIFRANPNMTPGEIDDAWEHGTRVGTFALMIFALTTFASSVILPWVIVSSHRLPPSPSKTPMTPHGLSPTAQRTPNESSYFAQTTSSTPAAGAADITDALSIKSLARKTWLSRLRTNMPSPEIPGLTLRRAWLLSHLLFALLTLLTFVAHTPTSATILVALIGIPWSLTMWAPFALIAAEVSKREAIRQGRIRAPATREGELLARGESEDQGADQAGVVLGIHNVAIAAPQVVATLVSSAIFRALQKPRGSVGDESVAWVLRVGGCCALVAAWLTRNVGEEGEEEEG